MELYSGIGEYQQDKDVEKEPVSKDLETLQLPQNLDQQTLEIFPPPTLQPSKDLLTVSIILPYVHHWAESIHWILTPINVCVCFCLHQILRHCNKTALYLRSEQELSIPCAICDRAYVGQTCQTLGQQMKEHKMALIKNCNVIKVGNSHSHY